VRHLETVNDKLVPDLLQREAEIYELKQHINELEKELNIKDRECYSISRQL